MHNTLFTTEIFALPHYCVVVIATLLAKDDSCIGVGKVEELLNIIDLVDALDLRVDWYELGANHVELEH